MKKMSFIDLKKVKAEWLSVLDDIVSMFKLRPFEFLAAYDGIVWALGMKTRCTVVIINATQVSFPIAQL